MVSWSTRRQFSYSIIFVGIIAVLGIGIFGSALYEPATCNDDVQNQGEVGVDCGGPCTELCPSQVGDLVVLWSRSLESIPGSYDAIALVENPNPQGGVEVVDYSFKLYDQENILISEREGRTFANANETFSIFEPGVVVGGRIPTRTFLSVTPVSPWTIIAREKPKIVVTNRRFEIDELAPKLRATVVNESFFDVEDILISAILFDEQDNAVATSQTHIDFLPKDNQQNISFIFPHDVTKTPARIEILPRVQVVGNE